MPVLKEKPTLHDFQTYIREMEDERGFSNQSSVQKCLLLGEETGELFKAVRKQEKMGIDSSSITGNISEELADIFIYLCAIANRYNIDLEKAFVSKEEENKKRKWN